MGLEEERIASAVRVSWGPGVKELPARRLIASLLQFKA
jgi:hypothetical protein